MKQEVAMTERIRNVTVSFRLPVELKVRVDNLAEKTGRSSSSLYAQLVADHIDELEKIYECLAIAEGVKKGQIKTYTTEEVEKELGH